MTLVELVLAVNERLVSARLPHAFGGALALAYVAEPRATVDIDVNVFVPLADIDQVLEAFAALDLGPERNRDDWLPMAGIRLRRSADPYPVDLFPSLDPRYEEIRRRCIHRPFGPEEKRLPFLSAEDLAVFKLSFGRAKDWVDLSAVARSKPDLDLDYVENQVVGLRGPSMYPRVARLRALVRAAAE